MTGLPVDTEAANYAARMLAKYGYLVIGKTLFANPHKRGDVINNWGNAILPYDLRITKKTDRADWNRQKRYLKIKVTYKSAGAHFYQAVPIRPPPAPEP